MPHQQPLDLPDWTVPTPQALLSPLESPHRSAKKPLAVSNPQRPPIPKTKWKTESTPTKRLQSASISAPIDLNLADDEFGHRSGSQGNIRPLDPDSPELERKKAIGSPVENLELLYEYFPLSLDDWYVLFHSVTSIYGLVPL